jgi:hypothetical protein
MTGPLIFVGVFAVLIVLWGLDKPSVGSVYARLHCSPRAKGTSDASPPCAPLVPARVREVVTGDQRELLKLIDSERNRP